MRRRKRFSREETRVTSCLSPLGIDHVHNLTLVLLYHIIKLGMAAACLHERSLSHI